MAKSKSITYHQSLRNRLAVFRVHIYALELGSSRAWQKRVIKINGLRSKFNQLSLFILLLTSFYDEKPYHKLQLGPIPIYPPNSQFKSDPAPTEVSEMLVQVGDG